MQFLQSTTFPANCCYQAIAVIDPVMNANGFFSPTTGLSASFPNSVNPDESANTYLGGSVLTNAMAKSVCRFKSAS